MVFEHLEGTEDPKLEAATSFHGPPVLSALSAVSQR
jgi:hypothetical protein